MEHTQHEHQSAARDADGGEQRTEHHRRHASRRRSKRSKFKKFIKKHKHSLINVAILVLALTAVILMGLLGDWLDLSGVKPAEVTTTAPQATEDQSVITTLRVEVTHFSQPISLIHPQADAFVNRISDRPFYEAVLDYRESDQRLDIGYPVTLSYHVGNMPTGLYLVGVTVEVAEDPSFTDARLFRFESYAETVQIYLLKTSAVYYYRVGVVLSDQTTTYTVGSFTTADTPRILSIGGIANVRDIGGWKTADGKTVKQGLLYRGTELDGAVCPDFVLTDAGLHDMLKVLGIRTDMDLRSKEENPLGTHALGANVKHIYYGVNQYSYIFDPAEYGPIRSVFSDLADPGKYPVYLHCTYGCDRTGTVCFLLGALLGVSEEDLRRDYELSALYFNWFEPDAMNDFVAQLKTWPGNTLQEKTENFLLSVGVTAEQLASIRQIYLGT